MDNEQVKRMRAMVERMYWEHGYRVEEIVQRLRLSMQSVEAVVARDYVETSVWNEDTGTYTVKRVQRQRAQERPRVTTTVTTAITTAKDKDNMIFPDMPKRYTASASISTSTSISTKEPAAETPLQGSDDRTRMIRQQLERIAQRADGIQTPLHRAQNTGLAHTDPAARLGEWLELTALITGFVMWVTYWLGVHRGAW